MRSWSGALTQSPAQVLGSSPGGRFTPAGFAPPAGAVDDGPVLLFEANGDGQEDMLVTKGGNALPAGAREYQPQLLLGDGHGGFQPAPTGMLPAITTSVGSGGGGRL